jgi:hypothetical protein
VPGGKPPGQPRECGEQVNLFVSKKLNNGSSLMEGTDLIYYEVMKKTNLIVKQI